MKQLIGGAIIPLVVGAGVLIGSIVPLASNPESLIERIFLACLATLGVLTIAAGMVGLYVSNPANFLVR